jgi:predicted nucleic acid binding AN1-type Zn finger protein
MQDPVCKVSVSRIAQNIPTTRNAIPKQRYKKQKCDCNVLNVAKTDAAEPRS